MQENTIIQAAQTQLDNNQSSQMKSLYYFRTDQTTQQDNGDNLPISPTASEKAIDLSQNQNDKISNNRKSNININNITSDAVNFKEVSKEDEQRSSSLQSKQGPRTFKFRELNPSNTGKQLLDIRQTKRLSTPLIDSKSQLYQQYLSTGVSTPRSSLKSQAKDMPDKNKINNSEKPSTRGSFSSSQQGFNRLSSLNKRQDNNGLEIGMNKNGDFTPKISNKSVQIGNLTPNNKMNQMSKSTSQGFGLYITPKIQKQPLLYPYLSKREQDIMINQEKQMLLSSVNKRYSVNTPFSNTYLNEEKEGNFSQQASNSQAFQRQKKAMLRIIAAEEKHTQSAQEKGREERFTNSTFDNENSSFTETANQRARNKAATWFTSRNPEGSYEQNYDQEDYDNKDEENNNNNNNNKSTNNSFDSLIDSPLSPPPKGSQILAESKFRRSFNFISSGGALNRKSFTRLPQRAATNLINPLQHQTPPSLLNSARQNMRQLPQISNTTSIHVSEAQNANNNIFVDKNQLQQQQNPSVSLTEITPFVQRQSIQSTGNNNNNIFNVKSLRLTVPPQSKNIPTKEQSNTKINEQGYEQGQQQLNQIKLVATKEEDENDQRDIQSTESIPSPNLLMKRKRIEESSKQENQLSNMYMTSYKHIGEILEENSFFKVINSIEEDMLSTTIQNKALLPKKLGVLGTLRASITQGKQIADEAAQVNGFLNLIKSKSGLMSKQKLQLSRLNIGNAYAGMVGKALSHVDLAELKSINLSYNHFDGGAVFKIGNSLSESIQSIDLSNNNIGSSGTRGLIPLFDSKKFSFLRKLNLENNNIADLGLNTIIPSIFRNMSISVLNISHNKLSDASCTFIKKLLLNSSYLQELYLHWNKFSSYGGILIAQGLAENLNIKVLDLSHNGLGGVPKLRCGQKIIQSCNVLESAVRHLDLSYNQFSAQECLEIGEALKINHSLYGVHLEGNQCQALVDPRGFLHFPEKNETKHMSDAQIIIQRIHSIKTIGMNKMQSFDCKAFDNCWICHGWQEIRFEISSESSDLFTGEPVFLHLDFEDYQPIYMDADPEDKSKFFLYRMCPPNRKISFFFSDPCKNVLYTSKGYQLEDFKINEQMNLKIEDIHTKEQEKPKQPQPQPVPDNKKQGKDKKDNNKTNQKTNKNNKTNTAKGSKKKAEIVPPKQQIEIVQTTKQVDSKKQPELEQKKSKNAQKSVPQNSQDSDQSEGDSLIEDEVMEALDEASKVAPKKFKVKYLDGTVIQYHTPKYVNTIQTTLNRDIISKAKDYDPIIKAKPRQVETFFLITKSNLWHRGISLFRDYIPDSPELDKRCFEFDWVSSKLPKILEKGADIGECKKILHSMYPMLRIAYKYLSSQGVTNDVFCITQNPFSTFAQRAQLIDNQLLYVRDIDFNFISASNIALKAKTYRNPDKALIRNEFLEIMGRIAMDKYIRNEKVKTNSEAIKLFFHEEGLLNHLYEFDSPQEWRNTRYWNQECDIKLKEQLPFLKSLYNMIADSRKNEKRYFTTVKSMSMAEFKDMVLKYDLLDDLLVDRDIALSFNLAMMTQVDELTVDRHFQMTFVEFLEALARLAEKKSMTPLGEITDEYSIEERIQIKLHYKIESMIALIKKKQELLVLKENQGQKDQQSQQPQAAGLQKDSNKRMSIQPQQLNARKSIKPEEIPSTNFLRQLAQKQKSMNEFDDEKEKSKIQLKGVISKIMNKEMALPVALSPIPEDKLNQNAKNFDLAEQQDN